MPTNQSEESAYQEACAVRETLRQSGWVIRVWDNCGWHWKLSLMGGTTQSRSAKHGNVRRIVLGKTYGEKMQFTAYASYDGSSLMNYVHLVQETPRFDDPNDAVDYVLRNLRMELAGAQGFVDDFCQ